MKAQIEKPLEEYSIVIYRHFGKIIDTISKSSTEKELKTRLQVMYTIYPELNDMFVYKFTNFNFLVWQIINNDVDFKPLIVSELI